MSFFAVMAIYCLGWLLGYISGRISQIEKQKKAEQAVKVTSADLRPR
jgi:hypothetical protein